MAKLVTKDRLEQGVLQVWKVLKGIMAHLDFRVLWENKELRESKESLENLEKMEEKEIKEILDSQDHLAPQDFKEYLGNLVPLDLLENKEILVYRELRVTW